jgi:hypothetical protein
MQDVANGRVAPDAGVASINTAWAGFQVPQTLMETAKSVGAIASK